jgi:hypothetical protein
MKGGTGFKVPLHKGDLGGSSRTYGIKARCVSTVAHGERDFEPF